MEQDCDICTLVGVDSSDIINQDPSVAGHGSVLGVEVQTIAVGGRPGVLTRRRMCRDVVRAMRLGKGSQGR